MYRYLATLGVAALTIATGCEKVPPTGTVKGTVSVKGKPFSNASVMMLDSQSGNGGSADIDSAGTFVLLEPLPVGKYTLYFAPKSTQVSPDKPTPFTPDKSVPQMYWSVSTSDLSYNVKEGENSFDVVVK